MKDEHRRYPRHRVWFPVQVDTDDREASVAACINASASGLLLRTPVGLRLGEQVRLTFRSTRSSGFVRVTGEIVRSETDVSLDETSPSIWPNTVAVRFACAVPKIELLLQCSDERSRPRRISERPWSQAG